MARLCRRLFQKFQNVFNDCFGFRGLILELKNPRCRSAFACRPKFLFMPLPIKGNQAIRHGKDFGSTAVICFQADNFRLRPILFEAKNMCDLGASPTINGLVVVPHHTEAAVRFGEQLGDFVLTAVGVLVFVDQNVVKSPRLLLPDIFKILQ